MIRRLSVLIVVLLLLGACTDDDSVVTTAPPDTEPDRVIELDFDFVDGSDGWASDIADFSPETRPEDFLSQTGEAAEDFEADNGYFHLAASNRSDDLFMFMTRQLTAEDGIVPDAEYYLEYRIRFLSAAPTGCAGIGGSPGESVWMKVGGAPIQPTPVEQDGMIRLNVDKGGQSEGGTAAEVAGVIANGIPCEEALDAGQPYAEVTLEHGVAEVTSDAEGNLWLLVGTDSGFEGRTSIYYDLIHVTLTRTDAAAGLDTP